MKRLRLGAVLVWLVLLGCGLGFEPVKVRTVELAPGVKLIFWLECADDAPACWMHVELKKRWEKGVHGAYLSRDEAEEYSLHSSHDGNVYGLYLQGCPARLETIIDVNANRCIPSKGGSAEEAEARRLLQILEDDLGMDLDLCDGWPDCVVIPDCYWSQ